MERLDLHTFRAHGAIYRIRKAPCESDDDVAERGWWLANACAKSADAAQSPPTAAALVSRSFQALYGKHGMKY